MISLTSGCDNLRFQPLVRSARLPPEGTVPVKDLHYEPTGESFPTGLKIDRAFLEKGRMLFETNCSVCHGLEGRGDGIVTRKGFTPPPSFHEDRLQKVGAAYFYQMMTFGGDRMPSYQRRLSPLDRWHVAAYIEVLQLSKNFRFNELDITDRERLP